MNAPFGNGPDWWSLFTRMPFPGAFAGADPRSGPSGTTGPAGAAIQQFLASCEQYRALMQTLAAELGRSAQEHGGPSLLERLCAWQRSSGTAGGDPFTILRELGAIGIPAAPAGMEDLRRLTILQSRALELQAQMLAHGAEIAHDAMQRFTARTEEEPSTLAALYSAWIDCAEDAYAMRVHREDYCQTQAELTNTLNALRQEQRQMVEAWARALDLPTRTEMNALIRRIRALEEAQTPRSPSNRRR